MARLTKKQEKSVLDGLTLMDDALFTMCFDGSAECASVMLSVLLCRDDLTVTEATTQKWIEGAEKHSVKLDIYARDREGNIYDIEIQRASKGGREQAGPLLQRDDRFRCPEEGHGMQ